MKIFGWSLCSESLPVAVFMREKLCSSVVLPPSGRSCAASTSSWRKTWRWRSDLCPATLASDVSMETNPTETRVGLGSDCDLPPLSVAPGNQNQEVDGWCWGQIRTRGEMKLWIINPIGFSYSVAAEVRFIKRSVIDIAAKHRTTYSLH